MAWNDAATAAAAKHVRARRFLEVLATVAIKRILVRWTRSNDSRFDRPAPDR